MSSSDPHEHPPVAGVTIHAAEKDWAVGETGACLIIVWRGSVTEPAVLLINERIWNLAQRRGSCAYINVIEPSSPVPSTAMRKLVMAGIERPGSGIACLAAVAEGDEFRQTVVRAILAGMALLRPTKQPSNVFKQTREMSVWVNQQLNADDDDVQALVHAIEVIRTKMPT